LKREYPRRVVVLSLCLVGLVAVALGVETSVSVGNATAFPSLSEVPGVHLTTTISFQEVPGVHLTTTISFQEVPGVHLTTTTTMGSMPPPGGPIGPGVGPEPGAVPPPPGNNAIGPAGPPTGEVDGEEAGLSTGWIVLIAVAAAIVLIILGILFYLLGRNGRRGGPTT
jgi:hypothetical protein